MSARAILGAVATTAMLGLGYGMWLVFVPGEDKRQELVKTLPESNPMRLEESRKRNALVMQALKEAAETKENVLKGIGGPGK